MLKCSAFQVRYTEALAVQIASRAFLCYDALVHSHTLSHVVERKVQRAQISQGEQPELEMS